MSSSAGERADRDPALLIGEREDIGRVLEQPAFARVGRAAVIDEQHRPIGVVSLTDIQRAIRASSMGDAASSGASLAPH